MTGSIPPASVDVSVCIVNWNCRELLRNCLASLLEAPQGCTLEVIVVDNASTDGAADLAAREFPDVRLIRNAENLGFSRGNNQAARIARGRFLFFLNNDTVVPPDTLGELLRYHQAHPEIILLGPRLLDGAGQVQMSFRKQPSLKTFLKRTLLFGWLGREEYQAYRRVEVGEQPCDVEVLLGAALFCEREKIQKLGLWDEDFPFGGEDLDLCLRARTHGRVVHHPGIGLTHFGRASTRQHVVFATTRIAVGFVRYFRKAGAPEWKLWLYKLALTLDAPVQVVVKGCQAGLRWLFGRTGPAAKSWNVVQANLAFLFRGLLPFWRA